MVEHGWGDVHDRLVQRSTQVQVCSDLRPRPWRSRKVLQAVKGCDDSRYCRRKRVRYGNKANAGAGAAAGASGWSWILRGYLPCILSEPCLQHLFAHRHVAVYLNCVMPNFNLFAQRESTKPIRDSEHVGNGRRCERIHLALGEKVTVRWVLRVGNGSCNRCQPFLLGLGN